MKKITSKTKLNKVIGINPKAAEILFESGLQCIGCPMAMQETIEQGCLAHGMNKKEIDKLVKKLNIIHEHKFSKKVKRAISHRAN